MGPWRACLIAVSTLVGCGEPPPFQELLVPNGVTVTEGQSSTFELRLLDPPPKSRLRGAIGPAAADSDKVLVTPSEFDLSPTSYPELITITALVDLDAMDESIHMGAAIYGDIGHDFWVYIIDTNIQHIVPDSWDITMPPASTATVGIRLTQPPSAALTVALASSDDGVAAVSPTTMVFGAANYDVAQPATIDSTAAGFASIGLSPPLTGSSFGITVE
jgi:hypothetical protein